MDQVYAFSHEPVRSQFGVQGPPLVRCIMKTGNPYRK